MGGLWSSYRLIPYIDLLICDPLIKYLDRLHLLLHLIVLYLLILVYVDVDLNENLLFLLL